MRRSGCTHFAPSPLSLTRSSSWLAFRNLTSISGFILQTFYQLFGVGDDLFRRKRHYRLHAELAGRLQETLLVFNEHNLRGLDIRQFGECQLVDFKIGFAAANLGRQYSKVKDIIDSV